MHNLTKNLNPKSLEFQLVMLNFFLPRIVFNNFCHLQTCLNNNEVKTVFLFKILCIIHSDNRQFYIHTSITLYFKSLACSAAEKWKLLKQRVILTLNRLRNMASFLLIECQSECRKWKHWTKKTSDCSQAYL